MYENGKEWDGKVWSGGNVTIPGLGVNDSLGVNRRSDGSYEFFTVNATVYRDPQSYYSITGTSADKGSYKQNFGKSELDYIQYEKKDLFSGQISSIVIDKYQTVDNMVTDSVGNDLNQPYYSKEHGWIQGNTVVSDQFKQFYKGDSDSYAGNVLVINNATTLSENRINFKGYDGVTDGRFLGHSNRDKKRPKDWKTNQSDGCFITSYDNQMKLLKNVGGKSK